MFRSVSILILFVITSSFAQQKIKDKLNYKVTYELSFKLDSTATEEPATELMILYAGDKLSVFSSRAKTLANQFEIKGNTGSTKKEAVTKFPAMIIKATEQNKVFYTLEIVDDLFYYEQDSNLFEWQIAKETKSIKEYQVQKATATFAGRDYTAWFTPEVPIADGPYKFNGLPGLILEISDDNEDYVYSFVGLEKLSPARKFSFDPRKYVNTTQEKLAEINYNYRKDPMGYKDDPNVTMPPAVHKKLVEGFTKMLKAENNPIELE